MNRRIRLPLLVAIPLLLALMAPYGQTYKIHEFEFSSLTGEFYCEGATAGDLSGDGVMDIVYGPFWYEGPDFKKVHTYYEQEPFSIETYSNCFFLYTYDFDEDGRLDILRIGFPGEEAAWYRNPGTDSDAWTMHQIADEVSNESPTFADITGDGRPELVAINDGRYAYAEPGPDPRQPWPFKPISADRELQRFTHGMGIGDVNGDGRPDLLEATGWYEQPASLEGDPEWIHHPYAFARGGSQMFAYDVDGDGDNDVITAEYAHGWGLEWHEQVRDATGGIDFVPHTIMGETAAENPYGVFFSQLHAMDFVDMDGDGLKDIVTGKRYWAHMGKDPGGTMPTVLYWFKLTRTGIGVDFVPYLIGEQTGLGTQLVVRDLNDDALPDIIIGNKKGAAYYIHRTRDVSRETWEAHQPRRLSKSE